MKKLLLFFIILDAISINAQWSTNPALNTPIPQATAKNSNVAMATDGNGGAIIVNLVNNSDDNIDLTAQKINANGIVQWQNDGVMIKTATIISLPSVIGDGLGGAIISWFDSRNSGSDLYIQHIASNGSASWTNNGILIKSNAYPTDSAPELISDGNGGAIVAWRNDQEPSMTSRLYLQKITSTGNLQWGASGVMVADTPYQVGGKITSDNANSVIISWYDARSLSGLSQFAQRFNSSGNPMWILNGVATQNINTSYHSLHITSDNSNGAVICWSEKRNGVDYDIYAQHITGNGDLLWAVNGAVVYSGPGDQQFEATDATYLVHDTLGNTYVSFNNYGGLGQKHLLQRLDANGQIQWGNNGIPCMASGMTGDYATILSDNAGGIIALWDNLTIPAGDLYAQRFNESGDRMWGTTQIAVCTAQQEQDNYSMISNGNGGAIVCWQDARNDPNIIDDNDIFDIFAQNICSNGQLGQNCTLSTNDITIDNEVILFPNPAQSFMNIQLANNQTIDRIIITDMTGKKVLEKNQHLSKINIETLSSGMYLIRIYSGTQGYQNKFLKQ